MPRVTKEQLQNKISELEEKIRNLKQSLLDKESAFNTEKENIKRIYDLEERAAKFGEDIIEFAKKIPKNMITIPIISQLIQAGTSIGANYCEADCAELKKDFIHKIGLCKKESKETKH